MLEGKQARINPPVPVTVGVALTRRLATHARARRPRISLWQRYDISFLQTMLHCLSSLCLVLCGGRRRSTSGDG